MDLIHEEVYKDKTLSLDLIKFSYEENIFPVYSNAHWLYNMLQMMANPFLIINITIYNCIFSLKCSFFKKE